nr:hypothetical protein [Tanacetum cinerariifolium]
MSTQQDIYAASSESRPAMLNKENYVPCSSRLLRYAKSRPNGKLIHNSILNCPYVRKMIPEPGDANREITVTKIFHLQTDDELFDKELKQIEADDQAIQTILLGLSEDIYAAVDSCETAQKIWLRVQQIMKGSHIEIQEKKAKLFNEWERLAKTHDPLALMANYNNPYVFPAPHQDQPSFNQNYLQQPMTNPEDITDPTSAMNMALALMEKACKLNCSTTTNNNQRISSNPRNRQIAQPGHYARNCTVRQRRRNAAYLQTQLLIAQKEEAGIQLQAKDYDLMAAATNLDEIEEVNANCILMDNLQQASTSGAQTDSTPVYDTDGSAEVHENCDDNDIFNMFTQEDQYTELLEPIPESHQVPQNDNNVIYEDTSMEQVQTPGSGISILLVVGTPSTGSLFMPPKPDLSYISLEEFTSEPAVETLNAKTSEDVPKLVKKDNCAQSLKIGSQMMRMRGNPQIDLQEKGLIDNGCSRHMTGNMSYLIDYEEIDRGYVAFGDYILLPLWTTDPPFPQELKSSQDARFKPSNDVGKKDFMVYQMDVNSSFLYGKIKEGVCVYQPSGFEDPNFPDKFYKVEKALYGLHQGLQVKQKQDGIFVSQDKYVAEILKKFRFFEVKTTSAPMETQKPLLKDEDGEEVDVHIYRSMIGSLMYLTSARSDIMFVVGAYAKYQVNPKVSHLHVVLVPILRSTFDL